MAEVAADARTAADTIVAEIDQPGIGPMLAASGPWRWNEERPPARPAPVLSAHTDEVLGDVLGLTNVEIGRLRARGIV